MTLVDAAWLVPAIAVAGSCGAVARHLLVQVGARHGAMGRAAAIAACNLAGSLVLAGLVALDTGDHLGGPLRLVAGSGFCGALTTFSGWVVEAVMTRRRGERGLLVVAGLDLVGQLLMGVGLAYVLLRLV